MRIAFALALLVGCTTSDYTGVYEITAHQWVAEIEVAPDKLPCSAPGSPINDVAYFGLVTDSSHAHGVQYVTCADPSACTTHPDYAWYSVDGTKGVNAQANVVTMEFGSPHCALDLTTFEISPGATLHLDMYAWRASDDNTATCTIDRAKALASGPTCIWVERLDGRLVQ
jgi:hypothetical protein